VATRAISRFAIGGAAHVVIGTATRAVIGTAPASLVCAPGAACVDQAAWLVLASISSSMQQFPPKIRR
jgi:hypothetical protein